MLHVNDFDCALVYSVWVTFDTIMTLTWLKRSSFVILCLSDAAMSLPEVIFISKFSPFDSWPCGDQTGWLGVKHRQLTTSMAHQARLDSGTEEDSIHQLDRAAQVTVCRQNWTLSTPLPPPQIKKIPIQTNVHAARSSNPNHIL